MRRAASASEDRIRAALPAVLVDVPDLEGDELRLFACGVLAQVLVQVRRMRGVQQAESVPDVKIAV